MVDAANAKLQAHGSWKRLMLMILSIHFVQVEESSHSPKLPLIKEPGYDQVWNKSVASMNCVRHCHNWNCFVIVALWGGFVLLSCLHSQIHWLKKNKLTGVAMVKLVQQRYRNVSLNLFRSLHFVWLQLCNSLQIRGLCCSLFSTLFQTHTCSKLFQA